MFHLKSFLTSVYDCDKLFGVRAGHLIWFYLVHTQAWTKSTRLIGKECSRCEDTWLNAWQVSDAFLRSETAQQNRHKSVRVGGPRQMKDRRGGGNRRVCAVTGSSLIVWLRCFDSYKAHSTESLFCFSVGSSLGGREWGEMLCVWLNHLLQKFTETSICTHLNQHP